MKKVAHLFKRIGYSLMKIKFKMKKFWCALTFIPLLFGSCKEECVRPVDAEPKIKVIFHTTVNGQEVQSGVDYNRTDGESFQVDLMKYYISHFALVNEVGDSLMINDHTLIDPINQKKSFSKDVESTGSFQHVRFLLGVDELHNHSGNQEGDLDPVNGMIWTWSTGYIFFKHEGTFLDTSGASLPLLYHYGQDRALVTADLPIAIDIEEGKSYEIHIDLNLAQLYKDIAFTDNNVHQSAGSADNAWIDALKQNFRSSFQVTEVKESLVQ